MKRLLTALFFLTLMGASVAKDNEVQVAAKCKAYVVRLHEIHDIVEKQPHIPKAQQASKKEELRRSFLLLTELEREANKMAMETFDSGLSEKYSSTIKAAAAVQGWIIAVKDLQGSGLGKGGQDPLQQKEREWHESTDRRLKKAATELGLPSKL